MKKNKTSSDYVYDTITVSINDDITIDLTNEYPNLDFSNIGDIVLNAGILDSVIDTTTFNSDSSGTWTFRNEAEVHHNTWYEEGSVINIEILNQTPDDKLEHAELKLSGVCPACRSKLPNHEWNCVNSYQSATVTIDSSDFTDMWTDVRQFTTMNTQNDK